jgi:hypothetical protein
LVKDEVSGALLIQAIRAALYTNHRWQEQKHSAFKSTQRFHWASEKCQALFALGTRLVNSNKSDSVLACAKAIGAIVENYSASEAAAAAGRADLLIALERMARRAARRGNPELARQLRAMLNPPQKSDYAAREEFEAAMRQRIEQLDLDPAVNETESGIHDNTDLAQVLRQILETVS